MRSIAQRFDDPTTTPQALHRLHDLLRQIAPRLAFDEIRLAGASEPQVTRKMCAALDDLKSVAPPGRQGPLDRQVRLLTAAVRRSYEDEEDVVAALTPDTEGIGSGADVTAAPDLDSVIGLVPERPRS